MFGGDWQGYHGLSPGLPYIDPTPDYVLISASESNGYTNLQFERETTTEEDDDPHDVQYRVRNTAISRKVVGKSAIPKDIVGGFEFTVLRRNLKELARKAMEICLQVLKESNKSRFDSYSRQQQCIDHIPYYLSGLLRAHFFQQPFSK